MQHPVSNMFRLNVRRDNLLEDSFSGIMNVADVELLKSRLWIEFEGERGYDYGGVSRSAQVFTHFVTRIAGHMIVM